jgi:hypothetical protein
LIIVKIETLKNKLKFPICMDRDTLDQILAEVETFSEFLKLDAKRTGHITDGRLNLSGVAVETERHLAEVQKKFPEMPEDSQLGEAIARFTTDAYITYLDGDFVSTQNSTIYSADRFVESVRHISLEFGEPNQIAQFYSDINSGLKDSKRFMWKLLVNDIPNVLSRAKENGKYTADDIFQYVTDVMKHAVSFSQAGSKDKGTTFANNFNRLTQTYFSEQMSETTMPETRAALDFDILGRYASQGVIAGMRELQNDYGIVVNARWSSQPDGKNRLIGLGIVGREGADEIPYRSNINLEGVRVPQNVKDFLIALGEVATRNARARGLTTEIRETAAYIRNATRHL